MRSQMLIRSAAAPLRRHSLPLYCLAALLLYSSSPAPAQPDIPSKAPLAWNRYYTFPEMEEAMKQIAAAYPQLVELKSLGKSRQGREMWLMIVASRKNGPHESRPAMWIDGNIHGNEIQAGEVVVYTAWYLTKAYGHNAEITRILDDYSFYLMPSVNPDGRQAWFDEVQNPSTSRASRRPVDNDRDGLFDEDGPDDLDGDGSIGQMWKADPDGQFIRDRHDPRIFRRVKPGERGEWTSLGSEGIDNDGDGQINEDGPGGDDMNRNWPGGWLPEYAQGGAGPYPFESPETRCVGEWLLAHPNVAAGQSYHNSGGMILHGAGAPFRESFYPTEDMAVYNDIADLGVLMLPYYRNLITYRDLYTVHGGARNWFAESLGILSYTNEMWADAKAFQGAPDPALTDEQREQRTWLWRDSLLFGQTFTDYKVFDHPRYGKVLIGGANKWSSRNTPTFLLEEECHRNFAFTTFHADQMPLLSFDRVVVKDAGGGLWTVDVSVRNEKRIPTRLSVARRRNVGANDILECRGRGGAAVIASGRLSSFLDVQMDAVRHEPHRVQVSEGIPGRGARVFRFIVRGEPGAAVDLSYTAEKARRIDREIELKATE